MRRAGLKTGSLTLGVTLMLGACATPVPERDRGITVGSQGGSSELVFAGAGVANRLGIEPPTWEDARRDAALSYRPAALPTATDQWLRPSRPTLDAARSIYLRTNARSIIYFNRYP